MRPAQATVFTTSYTYRMKMLTVLHGLLPDLRFEGGPALVDIEIDLIRETARNPTLAEFALCLTVRYCFVAASQIGRLGLDPKLRTIVCISENRWLRGVRWIAVARFMTSKSARLPTPIDRMPAAGATSARLPRARAP
jgi:hypothetical protein